MKLIKKLAAIALVAVMAFSALAVPAFAEEEAIIDSWDACLYDSNWNYIRPIQLPNPETRNGKSYTRRDFNRLFDEVQQMLYDMGYNRDSYEYTYACNNFDEAVSYHGCSVVFQVRCKDYYPEGSAGASINLGSNDVALTMETRLYNDQHGTNLSTAEYYNLKYGAVAAAPAAAAPAAAAAAPAKPGKTHQQQLDENAAYEAAIRAFQAQIAANEAAYAAALHG